MKKVLIALGVLLTPVVTFAATPLVDNLTNVVKDLGGFVNALIAFFIGIAVVVFIYGLIRFVVNQGDEEKRAAAKWYMIYSILAIFIMVSIFGIIRLLGNTLGINQGETVTPPRI